MANQLTYFKFLASYLANLAESDSPEIFSPEKNLNRQYNYINMINSESVCTDYFEANIKPRNSIFEHFFPFSFNLSQKQAVKNAFSHNISIVEWPPWCGKTQTILNIIANAVMNDKTVAVVSNNNSAITNIQEKLEKEWLAFFVALLGNNANKEEFFENEQDNIALQTFLDQYTPNTKKFKYSPNEYLQLLDELYEKENQLKTYILELSNLNKEFEHFKIEKPQILQIGLNTKCSSIHYLRWKAFFENNYRWIIKWFHQLRIELRLHLFTKNFTISNLIDNLEQQYYLNKTKELESEINQIQIFLSQHNFEVLKEEYSELSLIKFKEKIYHKYKNLPQQKFNQETFKDNFTDFTKRYPVILSTSHSILGSINKNVLLDYLIFDEATQSDLLSSILALNCAKNLVVVGDSNQLEQIENERIYEESDSLARKYNIHPAYQYKNNSILSSVRKVFENKISTTLLKEHYRCHPKIINFCNEKFYNGELIIMTHDNWNSPFEIIHTVEGNHARKDPYHWRYNQREIDEIKNHLANTQEETGIISPFRNQANMLQKTFANYQNIEADTVHKFQGRQKNEVILSTVLNSLEEDENGNKNRLNNFVNNKALLNVAISRAVNKLILVTSDKIFNGKNSTINDLIEYIKYNTDAQYITKGNITSIFDILYSDYHKELLKMMKRYTHKEYPSEIAMMNMLDKIMTIFPNYKYAMHISLKNIIDINSLDTKWELTNEEKWYLKNPWTHIDFLIFNKISKKPEFAIEVDGIAYHEKNEKQIKHDKTKDKALSLAWIPIYRFKTNGSEEVNQIINLLKKY